MRGVDRQPLDLQFTEPLGLMAQVWEDAQMNMVVPLLVLMSVLFQIPTSQRSPDVGRDHASEIAVLLRQLYPIETDNTVKTPNPEAGQRVELKLTQIAEQSPEGRAQVIEALIKVVEDPEAMREWPIARRWMLAVDLLGYLRATEAIDVLVRNLDHTGENGIMSSIHMKPVNGALDNIGEPAVPALIRALAGDDEEIRDQAAATLGRIGKPALSGLLEALSGDQPSVKGRAALVLALIGGKEAKQGIERAIEMEKNEEHRRELREALTEFNRRWSEQ